MKYLTNSIWPLVVAGIAYNLGLILFGWGCADRNVALAVCGVVSYVLGLGLGAVILLKLGIPQIVHLSYTDEPA